MENSRLTAEIERLKKEISELTERIEKLEEKDVENGAEEGKGGKK